MVNLSIQMYGCVGVWVCVGMRVSVCLCVYMFVCVRGGEVWGCG